MTAADQCCLWGPHPHSDEPPTEHLGPHCGDFAALAPAGVLRAQQASLRKVPEEGAPSRQAATCAGCARSHVGCGQDSAHLMSHWWSSTRWTWSPRPCPRPGRAESLRSDGKSGLFSVKGVGHARSPGLSRSNSRDVGLQPQTHASFCSAPCAPRTPRALQLLCLQMLEGRREEGR